MSLPPYVKYVFVYIVCIPIFLFIFLLSSRVMMFLGVVFLVFILLRFHQCPWVSTLRFPQQFGEILSC